VFIRLGGDRTVGKSVSMAGLNITNSSTTGIYLSDTLSNPVSIAAGVDISSSGSDYAIGSAVPFYWTIVNSGSLLALGTVSLAYGIVLEPGSAANTTPLGNISNSQSGLIEGYYEAVVVLGAGTVTNLGTIIARAVQGGAVGHDTVTSAYVPISGGVLLDQGGVSNAGSAVIHGYFAGVAIAAGGSVTNAGTIEGISTYAGYGVVLTQGGTVTNLSGGTIAGGYDAIEAFTDPITVFNQGLLAGGAGFGIAIDAGGSVTNATGGTISADRSGIQFFRPGANYVTNAANAVIAGGGYGVNVGSTSPLTLINAGSVTGMTSSGVLLHSGGLVDNATGGTIQGGKYGLSAQDTTTLTNAGLINGTANVGVVIQAAASISNAASGQIIGGQDGIYTGGSVYSTITNDGYILGSTGTGAVLNASGAVTNDATGTIVGAHYGVQVINGSGSVLNAGSIGAALAGNSAGVMMGAGGYVSNSATAAVSAQYYGVEVRGSEGTVVNAGTISSHQAFGGAAVQLAAGGSVTNAAGGLLRSQWIGVQIGTTSTVATAGTVDNQGTIIATDGTNGAGIWITGPGVIYNGPSGVITNGPYAVVAYNEVTLVNAGSIGGSLFGLDAIGSGFADRIVAEPGAMFSGVFSGGNTIGSAIYSTLELASGAFAGTITNVGTFIDFGQIGLDAGATWSLGGTIAAGETVAFGGTNSSLTLLNPAAVNATMSGFGATDTLILAGVTSTTGVSFSGNTLIISESTGPNLSLEFDAPGDLSYAVADGSTDITVACFAEGTHIDTVDGRRTVETLRPGMQVLSAFRGYREIIWIGHRHVDCARHPRPRTAWPIEIKAGTFGPGQPVADLRVSPEHAIYVNQVLIPARFLVNGTTIRQVEVSEITYYHVELPRHDVLFAEGLPAESYLDIGDRSNFAGSPTVRLFPDFATPAPNLATLWEALGCAPLVIHGPELEAARAQVKTYALNAA
jgi:hypothetical protein